MTGTRWGATTRAACAALAAAALCGAVAACGSSSGDSSPSATNAAATSPAASTTESAASTSNAVTAPGTKLSVGQSAKVAYTPAGSGPSSTLRITVQSFEKGSLADFSGIQLDAAQKASTPYYVKVHVTNLGPHAIDIDSSAAAIEGLDSTGNDTQSVTFIGTFPRCPDTASTIPMGPGRGYDDCLTFLVPGGITKVSYNGTNNYIDSPVTWAPN